MHSFSVFDKGFRFPSPASAKSSLSAFGVSHFRELRDSNFSESLFASQQRRLGSLERLVHFLLQELPFTYIFVDGLDEADYTDTHHLGYLHRHNKEVPDFITFLIREAVQSPEKLRLWCSSQPSPRVQEYLCQPVWKKVITEIPLTIEDTSDDIQSYLLSAIPDATLDTMTFAKLFIQGAVATEVEGSFLWASSMLEGLKEDAEDIDDLIRLASEGSSQ
jgi:hypothetical protein